MDGGIKGEGVVRACVGWVVMMPLLDNELVVVQLAELIRCCWCSR